MILSTFSDIFKSSFLENMASFSVIDSGIALLASFALGLFIYFIYKKTFLGVLYSESFNLSLLLLTLLTTFIILAVTSNVVLSLGMVGALSIVRFRTAIKDPLDLVFLFWAIGGGIVMGAGLIPLGLFGSAIIGLILFFRGRSSGNLQSYLLVLSCEGDTAEIDALGILNQQSNKLRLKSKTKSERENELIYELQLASSDTSFINAISSLEGIRHVQLVSYNGDYAG